MKKLASIFALSIAILLSGCSSSPEEIKDREYAMSRKLPQGCSFKYLGKFNTGWEQIPVVYIHCEGKTTTSINTSTGGKYHTEFAQFFVEN